MSQTYNLGKVAITPRGAYSSTAQYTPLDILSYNGSSYLVLQNCMGITPPNATYYMVVASKGDTGSAGASPTIAAGSVTMLPVGSSATVTNSGTSQNAVFNFGIPKETIDTSIIAEDFSTTKEYYSGDYCVHNGTMYRFTEDKSAGAWDDTKVASVDVASELTDERNRSIIFDDLYVIGGDPVGSIISGSTINLSGVATSNSKRCRMSGVYARKYQDIRRLALSMNNTSYEFSIALYGEGGSVSTGDGFIGYQDNATWYTHDVIVPISASAYGFCIVARRTDNANMTSTDSTAIKSSLKIYSLTDKTLTQANAAADAAAVGGQFDIVKSACIFTAPFTPNISSGGINSNGSANSSGYYRHTGIFNGRSSSGIKRYSVSFVSDTYQFRIASYGDDGSYAPSDFNGFLNDYGTGVVTLPDSCKKFGISFKRADNGTMSADDNDALRAGLSVTTNTDTTLSISGVAADAAAVGTAISLSASYPTLTSSQKQDILNLVDSYYAIRNNVVYHFVTTRNSFASKANTFDENNKLMLCCSAFTQLVWAGVDPSTFAEPDTYNADIVKAFDWGYFLKYLIRQKTDGLAIRENGSVTGLYGYRNPLGGIENGWSFNTRYAEDGNLPNSQRWTNALNAGDVACELFNNGYEVPVSKADVGDMVFYEEIPNGWNSYYKHQFRRIDHAALIIGKTQGFFEVAEVTSINGGNPPVVKRSIFSTDPFLAAKSGYMANRIVMVARHPSAYGVSGNVPSKFTVVPAAHSQEWS